MTDRDHDELSIRRLVENWVIWRDAGNWERLRTVWHEDGAMQATWFSGSAEDFIRASEEGWKRGVAVLHTLGGCSIDISGNRAVAQTKMTISQRATIEGVACDCVCFGRFFDLFERRSGHWGLVSRQPIYEKDRLDPVDTSARLALDQDRLAQMPAGYRHLAYLQLKIGMNVNLNLPGIRGPEVEALYDKGKVWLAGGGQG